MLFAVDFIPVESVAFRDFPDAYIEDWIDSLQRVELMDFDILAPGHGPLGRKEHVYMFREYMQDLHGAVLQYAREGKSLEEMKTLIKLPKYEKWASYQQWFPLNIEGMYRHVQLHRLQNPYSLVPCAAWRRHAGCSALDHFVLDRCCSRLCSGSPDL